MAESYFSPSREHHAADDRTVVTSPDPVDAVASAEDVQTAYLQHKDRLVEGMDKTTGILKDLRHFNKEHWVVRYPYVAEQEPQQTATSSSRRLQRSLSFADDPSSNTNVLLSTKSKRNSLTRSLTVAAIPESDIASVTDVEGSDVSSSDAETLLEPSTAADFRVLRLDLKLGAPGSSSAPATLVSQLEKASIANLLNDRITGALKHVDKLRIRVQDTSSKVLVTGDLNSGKSTFVNALLQRDVMPVDQQPCTTLFCEVHDKAENEGIEEAHFVQAGVSYDKHDSTTYTKVPLTGLEALVAEHEAAELLSQDATQPAMIRLYVGDARTPQTSLLANGVVDISLIDAPGLNRDSLHTTSLFARQEEIDVVVFVVSAENHFTLSAKEFLQTASKEKAYLFIVVNRFDQIKDKERCKQRVLQQIRQLSPHTFEDADDLVHFVDSSDALAKGLLKQSAEGKEALVDIVNSQTESEASFAQLEQSLRSFVLVKRAKSKLLPASTYLSNVLSDVDLLSSANAVAAQAEATHAKAELEATRPILEKMKKGRDHLEEGLEESEESATTNATSSSRSRLDIAIERVGKGKVAVMSEDVGAAASAHRIPNMPSYPGLLGIWDYARDVRRALLESIDLAVKLAEDEARAFTSEGVKSIEGLGEQHLPAHVERSKRVFMPEAMFVPRLKHQSSSYSGEKKKGVTIVAGGTQGLGIGLLPLSSRGDLTEVTFVDILDLNHAVVARLGLFGVDKNPELLDESKDDDASASALSTLGLGIGAITMVGGKTIGARGLLEGAVKLGELFGNEQSRKWIAPIVGAVTIGLGVYLVYELPVSIPRTVGRRIRVALAQPGSARLPSTASDAKQAHTLTRSRAEIAELPFVAAHVARIGRETRKVMRLAAWDVRERFRGAMEESGRRVKEAEDCERKAEKAMAWFASIGERTQDVRLLIGID